jgi:RHS repeat-associated protein
MSMFMRKIRGKLLVFGGGLLLLVSMNVMAQVTYVYTDPQGTPLAEADVNGNITATFDYAPYGSIALGTTPNGPGYTGHVNDPDTGLVYMQARYYDPNTGRFLSVDPAQPSAGNSFNFNRYGYANNNPVVNTDPTGKIVNLVNQDATIVKLINSRAVGTFSADKNGNLQITNSKGDSSKFSSTYTSELKSAISSKSVISVSIGKTFTDPTNGSTKSVDADAGGGVTIGARSGGNQTVVISGNPNTSLKDTSGSALRDAPADILEHELGGHAIPHVIGPQSGNAVQDENKIRSEVPGSGQRAPEPSHQE